MNLRFVEGQVFVAIELKQHIRKNHCDVVTNLFSKSFICLATLTGISPVLAFIELNISGFSPLAPLFWYLNFYHWLFFYTSFYLLLFTLNDIKKKR
jgi:hypothetical protein